MNETEWLNQIDADVLAIATRAGVPEGDVRMVLDDPWAWGLHEFEPEDRNAVTVAEFAAGCAYSRAISDAEDMGSDLGMALAAYGLWLDQVSKDIKNNQEGAR